MPTNTFLPSLVEGTALCPQGDKATSARAPPRGPVRRRRRKRNGCQVVVAAGVHGRVNIRGKRKVWTALHELRPYREARCAAGADSATAVESSLSLMCAADSDSAHSPSSMALEDAGTAHCTVGRPGTFHQDHQPVLSVHSCIIPCPYCCPLPLPLRQQLLISHTLAAIPLHSATTNEHTQMCCRCTQRNLSRPGTVRGGASACVSGQSGKCSSRRTKIQMQRVSAHNDRKKKGAHVGVGSQVVGKIFRLHKAPLDARPPGQQFRDFRNTAGARGSAAAQ